MAGSNSVCPAAVVVASPPVPVGMSASWIVSASVCGAASAGLNDRLVVSDSLSPVAGFTKQSPVVGVSVSAPGTLLLLAGIPLSWDDTFSAK